MTAEVDAGVVHLLYHGCSMRPEDELALAAVINERIGQVAMGYSAGYDDQHQAATWLNYLRREHTRLPITWSVHYSPDKRKMLTAWQAGMARIAGLALASWAWAERRKGRLRSAS